MFKIFMIANSASKSKKSRDETHEISELKNSRPSFLGLSTQMTSSRKEKVQTEYGKTRNPVRIPSKLKLGK
jgi:hypothetical protein